MTPEKVIAAASARVIAVVDSSKFERRSSLILCPLENVTTIITDDRISDEAAAMVAHAGIRLITVKPMASAEKEDSTSAA